MSVEDQDHAATYISHDGVVRTSRELEHDAWAQRTPTDLSESPVVVNGTEYYPVTEHAAFEVTYASVLEDTDDPVSQVATNITPIPQHGDCTHGTLANRLQITFLTLDGKQTRIVSQEEIQRVTPVTDLSDHFPVSGASERERAFKLETYAGLHPEAVDSRRVIQLLRSDDADTCRAAVAALRYIIDDRVDECIPATLPLRTVLQEGPTSAGCDAVYCLSRIAQTSPADAVIAADTLTEYLTSSNADCRESALCACDGIAREDPSLVAGHEETLVSILTSRDNTERAYAAKILAELAREDPQRLHPHIPVFLDRLNTTGTNFDEQIALMSAVGRIAQDTPGAVIDALPTIVACLNAGHEKLRANAAATMYDLAGIDPDAVASHVDDIAELLHGRTSYAKMNSTGALARLAETHPDAVANHVDGLIACLQDDRKEVRVNTCWVLQHLGPRAAQAEPALVDVASSDTDEDVQLRAYWALSEVTDATE